MPWVQVQTGNWLWEEKRYQAQSWNCLYAWATSLDVTMNNLAQIWVWCENYALFQGNRFQFCDLSWGASHPAYQPELFATLGWSSARTNPPKSSPVQSWLTNLRPVQNQVTFICSNCHGWLIKFSFLWSKHLEWREINVGKDKLWSAY